MSLKVLAAKALRGQERLVIVFWGYGILLQCVLMVLANLLSESAAQAGFKLFGLVMAVTVLTGMWVYSIGCTIAVWRCAYNVRKKFWGHAARVFVALVVIAIPSSLYNTVQWLGEKFT
jgi:magnesium-transporting ATPase (P-type)